MLDTFAGSQATSEAKGEFAGVDIVVATVVQCRLDVNHWIASDHTAVQCFADTLHDSWAVLLWHHAALDFIDKFKALTWLICLKSYPYVTVLTTTTRLLGMLTLDLRCTLDALAESNLWFTDVRFNLKFTLHAIDQNVEVQLTHARHDRLTSLFVGVNAEGWIFFGKSL